MNYFDFENIKNNEKNKADNLRNFLETISFLEKQENKFDLLLVDFDGVLLDISYREILNGLFYYFFNKNKFKEFVLKNKVETSVLKKIVELSKTTKIIILTGRFLNKKGEEKLKNIFPYISEDFINKLEKKFNIKLIPRVKKNLIPEELKSIQDFKKVVYLGSSVLDKVLANKLKKINENITYYQIGKNKLL